MIRENETAHAMQHRGGPHPSPRKALAKAGVALVAGRLADRV